MINISLLLSAVLQQQLKKKKSICANSNIYIFCCLSKNENNSTLCQGCLAKRPPIKSLFFENLAAPLSLPIWLPPSCSLPSSGLPLTGVTGSSPCWAAGLLGHGLPSLALIYSYGNRWNCCGFILQKGLDMAMLKPCAQWVTVAGDRGWWDSAGCMEKIGHPTEKSTAPGGWAGKCFHSTPKHPTWGVSTPVFTPWWAPIFLQSPRHGAHIFTEEMLRQAVRNMALLSFSGGNSTPWSPLFNPAMGKRRWQKRQWTPLSVKL